MIISIKLILMLIKFSKLDKSIKFGSRQVKNLTMIFVEVIKNNKCSKFKNTHIVSF